MNNIANNPTLEAYAELQKAFDHYNDRLFGGLLPYCLITMQREKRTYGYFSSRRFAHRTDKQMTDEIAMNPSYFGVVPLLEILQTLVHEMAHAWQFHFGDPGRRAYHNKEWADKMESIGLMPSSTGKPGGARTGEKMADYAIEGGLFMQATDELLATGFQVSWLDRHPPADAAGLLIAGDDDFAGDEVGELLEPKPGNRSNRDKYRCPLCGDQAWGKPGLKLLCGKGDCNAAPFELATD
ncbi:SprT-like domain-containing protein [Salmonella enterica]|nr:SprT-like domain-containing protein [Salmonella enterica]